ncbi:hypothetical protein, partial [Holdemanella biformis]|uniref:hypothetical protein n=1 Tax=Holdemanella biformis TaxID=1735 RepID=UPI002666581A
LETLIFYIIVDFFEMIFNLSYYLALTYNPQQRKKVAQSLYTRALDHFISFLAVKDKKYYTV